MLKVMTNYLATANLVTLCEALVTSKAAGMDLNTTFEAIRISSGNSFVHETESQVILNGSRDINFTMDLVLKDIGLFQSIAERANVPLEVSPLLISIFKDGIEKYGDREWSPNIVKRLEEATGLDILAPGFTSEMVDDDAGWRTCQRRHWLWSPPCRYVAIVELHSGRDSAGPNGISHTCNQPLSRLSRWPGRRNFNALLASHRNAWRGYRAWRFFRKAC